MVKPSHGSLSGGLAVLLTGNAFNPAVGGTVTSFGGQVASSVTCSDSSHCTAISSPGSADSTVHGTVTVASQTSTVSAADQYSYDPGISASVNVISLSSTSGPTAGGTQITVSGN